MKSFGINKLGINRSGSIIKQSDSNWTPLTLVVEDAQPTHVVMTGMVKETKAIASDFTIAGFTVSSLSRDATTKILTLTLSTAVVFGNVLNVIYKNKSYSVTNNVLSVDTPRNVVVTPIPGGNRITFAPYAGTQTEIWASIDGAAFALLTTLNIGVQTYDHTGLYASVVDYELRSKVITLNAPINLSGAVHSGVGADLTVTVNDSDTLFIEYWGKIGAGANTLLATVAVTGSTSTYTHAIQNESVEYEVRGKNTEFFSDYSSKVTVNVPLFDSDGEIVIKAGNTVGWYDFTDAALMTAQAGVQSIAWDKIYGKQGALGAELNSGVIELMAVYKITATTTNFFYTGCQVGDTFVCRATKTLDAGNKVQRYNGNHLGTFADANCPTNGVFNGSNSFMKTAPFTYNQPVFIYMVFRQLSWTNVKYVLGGNTASSPYIQQYPTTPKLIFSAGGAYPENANLALNTWAIARILYNGASSKFTIANTIPVTGSVGTLAMGGFTIGAGGGNSGFGNIEVKEIVLRNISDSSGDETKIFNYLATKYGLPTI